MRLRYTPEALVELDEILTGIAEHSPQGARRVQARIQAVIDFLLDYPHSGQSTDMDSLRRTTTHPYPYLVFYEPHDDEIVVIAVRHGARDLASMPDR